MYDQAVDGLREFIEGQKIGFGLNPDVTMGPLNMKRQRDYVEELLAESRSRGTEVVAGRRVRRHRSERRQLHAAGAGAQPGRR